MNLSKNSCPFCPPPVASLLFERPEALALIDGFPISPGHALIIPRRHFGTWHEGTPEEQVALTSLISEVQESLQKSHSPDGFNVGFNDGKAAGQTVSHLHIHVIPRYVGDVPDPRGGIRLIIPDKAKYWNE